MLGMENQMQSSHWVFGSFGFFWFSIKLIQFCFHRALHRWVSKNFSRNLSRTEWLVEKGDIAGKELFSIQPASGLIKLLVVKSVWKFQRHHPLPCCHQSAGYLADTINFWFCALWHAWLAHEVMTVLDYNVERNQYYCEALANFRSNL